MFRYLPAATLHNVLLKIWGKMSVHLFVFKLQECNGATTRTEDEDDEEDTDYSDEFLI